jgi:hypothetical protein
MNDDIPGRGFIRIVFDQPKECFEADPILAIDLQPHGDPGDLDFVEDHPTPNQWPQQDLGADVINIDRGFER